MTKQKFAPEKLATAVGKKGITKKYVKMLKKQNDKLEKRMREIEGKTKVTIKIPTVFYEKILECKINKTNQDINEYINYLIYSDLGKD